MLGQIRMLAQGTVTRPYYDWDGRKYLELTIDGNKFRIKIPFRYGRVMCAHPGLKTVHEFKLGDEVDVFLERKTWDGIEHWVLLSIKECSPETDT